MSLKCLLLTLLCLCCVCHHVCAESEQNPLIVQPINPRAAFLAAEAQAAAKKRTTSTSTLTMTESESLSMSQSKSQSISQSESQSISQSESQSISQSESKSISQSESQSVSQSESQSITDTGSETKTIESAKASPPAPPVITTTTTTASGSNGGTLSPDKSTTTERVEPNVPNTTGETGKSGDGKVSLQHGNSGTPEKKAETIQSGTQGISGTSKKSVTPSISVTPDLPFKMSGSSQSTESVEKRERVSPTISLSTVKTNESDKEATKVVNSQPDEKTGTGEPSTPAPTAKPAGTDVATATGASPEETQAKLKEKENKGSHNGVEGENGGSLSAPTESEVPPPEKPSTDAKKKNGVPEPTLAFVPLLFTLLTAVAFAAMP